MANLRFRWLAGLQGLVALLALAMLFRGQGRSATWAAVFLALPALRLALSADHRRATYRWLGGLWQQLERYPFEGRTPWLAVAVFVVLPTLALLCLQGSGLHAGDSEPVVLTAASLVRQGDWELSEYAQAYAGTAHSPNGELPYFLRRSATGVYSAYPLGMTMFAAPTALVGQALGADLDRDVTRERLEKWTAAWVTAGCLALFLLLALHQVSALPALVMTALLATGSAFYSTVGQALWQHGGVIFFSLAVLLLEFRQGPRRATGLTLLQGVGCAAMLACRLSAGLFVVSLGGWVLLRDPKRAVVLTLATTVAFAPWAWLHWSVYGTPLGPSGGQLEAANWSGDLLLPLAGVLLSPARGLLIYQPWLLLAAAWLVPAVRHEARRGPRVAGPAGWVAFCLVAIALHLALVSSWRVWDGGYCWGSRLASEVVPLGALLLLRPLAALWPQPKGPCAVLAVGLVALLLHVGALAAHAEQWNGVFNVDVAKEHLWSWTHPPFLFPLQFGRP